MKHLAFLFALSILCSATLTAQWVQIGPTILPVVTSLAVCPDGMGDTVLLASTPRGGVFRSTDDGMSWTPSNMGLRDRRLSSLFVTPDGSGGNVVFLGSMEGDTTDVFRSTDNGLSWTRLDVGVGAVFGFANLPNGTGSADVYVSTGYGIIRSTDGGVDWNGVDSVFQTNSVAVSPNGSGGLIIFAGLNGYGGYGGLTRSTDGGSTWTWMDIGIPFVTATLALRDTDLFAGTNVGIFRSTDNGASWTRVLDSSVTCLLFRGTDIFAGGAGLYRSTDNGTTWQAMNSGPTNLDIRTLAFKGSELFAGTGNGILCSTDDGISWIDRTSGIVERMQLRTMASAPNRAGGTDIFISAGWKFFYSSDNGDTWIDENDSGIAVVNSCGFTYFNDIEHLLAVPGDSGHTSLYTYGFGCGIFRSTDYGRSWKNITQGQHDFDNTSFLTTGPSIDGFGSSLYINGPNGLYCSSDDGADWWCLSSGLVDRGHPGAFSSVLTVTDSMGVVNMFGGGPECIYHSTDGGAHWTTSILDTPYCYAPLSIVAVPDGAGGTDILAGSNMVYRSTDFGATWNHADSAISARYVVSFMNFTSCSGNSSCLFAGTTQWYARIYGGVFLSSNSGASWAEIDSGMSVHSVLALTASPDGVGGLNVFAATDLDDGLWRRSLSEVIDFAPCNLNALPGNSQVTLNWNNQDHGNYVGYRIYGDTIRHPTNPIDSTLGAIVVKSKIMNGITNSTTRTINGIKNGTTYYFRITGLESGGRESGFSNEVAVASHQYISPVSKGWNMISVPFSVATYCKSILFPHATSDAFAYEGGYVRKDTLRCGTGYWLKHSGSQNDTIYGGLRVRDRISVKEGWNLVGSVSLSIAVSNITSNPPGIVTSSFFGYKKGYNVSDTIESGQGYWVKVDRPGQLILVASGSIPARNRIKIVSGEELPPPPPDEQTTNLKSQIPKEFALEQNYPNPLNPATTINYALPAASNVQLRIYNLLGQVVSTLVDGVQDVGYQTAEWDAGSAASGIYFYRLEATSTVDPKKSFTQVRKMILLT